MELEPQKIFVEGEEKVAHKVRELYTKIMSLRGKNFKGEKTYPDADLIYEIGTSLQKKYGLMDVYKYYLYHIMIGSTMGREKCIFFDFPGDDSILNLLEKAKKELIIN